jgi:hypothetical protein
VSAHIRGSSHPQLELLQRGGQPKTDPQVLARMARTKAKAPGTPHAHQPAPSAGEQQREETLGRGARSREVDVQEEEEERGGSPRALVDQPHGGAGKRQHMGTQGTGGRGREGKGATPGRAQPAPRLVQAGCNQREPRRRGRGGGEKGWKPPTGSKPPPHLPEAQGARLGLPRGQRGGRGRASRVGPEPREREVAGLGGRGEEGLPRLDAPHSSGGEARDASPRQRASRAASLHPRCARARKC